MSRSAARERKILQMLTGEGDPPFPSIPSFLQLPLQTIFQDKVRNEKEGTQCVWRDAGSGLF